MKRLWGPFVKKQETVALDFARDWLLTMGMFADRIAQISGIRLAAPIRRLTAPRGRIVLSGLLPSHANAALAAYRAQGLMLERRVPLDGWMTLVLRR